ncbi:hypothetical protein VNO77_21451 [Canavalia gladiata]|uniref:Uncharacterized protein n=1 Tax=Canavalia gladiata TaxID=3824 RepID=A0AAN9LR36_CANGL
MHCKCKENCCGLIWLSAIDTSEVSSRYRMMFVRKHSPNHISNVSRLARVRRNITLQNVWYKKELKLSRMGFEPMPFRTTETDKQISSGYLILIALLAASEMDSFKQIWGAEGCSSSESGWTMYIASPMQEDDAGCSNENDGYHNMYGENRRKKQGVKADEEESDDSMASDASSGPVQYHHTYAHTQSTHHGSKKDKQDHGSKCSSKKNANKQEKKSVDTRSKKK